MTCVLTNSALIYNRMPLMKASQLISNPVLATSKRLQKIDEKYVIRQSTGFYCYFFKNINN